MNTLLKCLLAFFIVACSSTIILAQDCDAVFLEYYKTQELPHPISNYNAFCEGVEEAKTTMQLSLKRNVNDVFSIPSCERFDYENRNIILIPAGQTYNEDTLDAIRGYNFMMSKKIRLRLGSQFKELGKLSDSYFGPENIFTEAFYDLFNDKLSIKKLDDEQIRLTLSKDDAFPDYLNSIVVKDRFSDAKFSFKELYDGVTVPLTEQDVKQTSKLFSFSLKEFSHPNFCAAKDNPDAFVVWVKLKEFLGKK
ncbi:MAG: hypothetical protein ACPGXL_10395 [Chitinophagales bacterium]